MGLRVSAWYPYSYACDYNKGVFKSTDDGKT